MRAHIRVCASMCVFITLWYEFIFEGQVLYIFKKKRKRKTILKFIFAL